jgi:hypothetical protein
MVPTPEEWDAVLAGEYENIAEEQNDEDRAVRDALRRRGGILDTPHPLENTCAECQYFKAVAHYHDAKYDRVFASRFGVWTPFVQWTALALGLLNLIAILVLIVSVWN